MTPARSQRDTLVFIPVLVRSGEKEYSDLLRAVCNIVVKPKMAEEYLPLQYSQGQTKYYEVLILIVSLVS